MNFVMDLDGIVHDPRGEGYAMEYESYLSFFKMLGFSQHLIICKNVPSCWAPLILYIGHSVDNTKPVTLPGWEFEQMDWQEYYAKAKDKRQAVEISCGCRPELIHAIFCVDTEWSCPMMDIEAQRHHKNFTTTNNAGYFRPEVREYERILREEYKPQYKRAVLVPCAADKPYPAPLHAAIRKRLEAIEGRSGILNCWHLIVATGVLGLIPEELWEKAPSYDVGVPNFDRCARTVKWYFTKWSYTRLVIYSDFYSPAIKEGLKGVSKQNRPEVDWIHGAHYRTQYDNLLLMEHLDELENVIRRANLC